MSGVYSFPNVLEFVNSGTAQTVSDLLTNFPASAQYLRMYGRVTDLWGSVATVMICESDASSGQFYWRPQRVDYAITSTQTSGGMSLVPLVTAPEICLQSTLLGAMTVTPSSTNAWPGCSFRIRSPASLGIFGLTVTGLIGGATASILGGGDKLVTYTASGWRA